MSGRAGKSGGRRPCKACGQGHGNCEGGLCRSCFKKQPPEPEKAKEATPDPAGERLREWLMKYRAEREWA
jgi:ribosomal protein S14